MSRARAACAVLVGVAFVAALGGPAMARSQAQDDSTDANVTLVAPTDWFASEDGEVVAEVEADLTADVPSGPRAQIVTVKHPKKTKTKAIVKKITAESESAPTLFDTPATDVFGAAEVPGTVITFSVTIDGTALVQRYVLLSLPDGTSTLIILEAPEDQWVDAEEALMSAFDVS